MVIVITGHSCNIKEDKEKAKAGPDGLQGGQPHRALATIKSFTVYVMGLNIFKHGIPIRAQELCSK